MFLKYTKILFKRMKKYDKNATNPFLKGNYDPYKTIYEQTYIWVEKNEK